MLAALVLSGCPRDQPGRVPMAIYGNRVVGWTTGTEPMYEPRVDPTPFPTSLGRIAITLAPDSDARAARVLARGIARPLEVEDPHAQAHCERPDCFDVVAPDDATLELLVVARATYDGELWQVDAAIHDALDREGPPIWRVRLYDADLYAAVGVVGGLLLPPPRPVLVGESEVRIPVYARQVIGVGRGTATVMSW